MSRQFVPHDYQLDAKRHVQANARCALFMPMGGGKTVTTLTALDELAAVDDIYPVLVLAPLRVARSTWPDEIAKWAHLQHLQVSTITGDVKAREAALAVDADIYTTNYEQLPWLVERFGEHWPFKTVIADELTRLKSFRLKQGSKRAAALGKVAHSKVDRFIGLTGTPAPNGLKDTWGQLWFLDKGQRLGKSFTAFAARWFYTGRDGFSLKPYANAQGDIQGRIQDICQTVTGLPVDEPMRNRIYVDMPRDARRAYDEMEAQMYTEIEGIGVEAPLAIVKTMKCLQLANGAAYVGEGSDEWTVTHDAKIEALQSVVEEANGAPVLVAYHFKSDLARLREAFPQGRVLDADPQTIRDWNNGDIPVLFAHPASAGHGLNLADGGHILAFFSVNWNLEEHMQIIERIGPMRQKQAGYDRPVMVHYILARNTVDDTILDRLEGKKSVQEALLEALNRRKGAPAKEAA
jgi:SNF2 family DNA or RNA helicase